MFFDRAGRGGEDPFLWRKADRTWHPLSWRQVANQVSALAHNLRELGLKDGDRVVLVSENRPEFCIADLAIMAAGCITVPTYTTNTERDHQHILDNSGASAVIVSTAKLARVLMPAVLRSNVKTVITMENMRVGQQGDVQVLDWEPLVAGGEAYRADFEARGQAMTRDDTACLIYTSGTGGAPRGVMQHHGAILHNAAGAAEVLVNDFGIGDEEVFLSFLPLSHAYEHSGGQFLPIMVGAQIYYSEGLEKLVSNIEETKPTIMVVVPRLFEVIRARMIKSVEKQGKLANWMLGQALRVGEKDYERRMGVFDRPVDILLNKLFRPKIQQRFGGRMKALVSGGAPLNPEIGVFFHSIGLTLLQGYGQTEAGPVISCNRPSVGLKMDTVGPPLMNTEVKIADDGEILVRGELVMKGYWRNKPETERVLVPDPAEPDKGPWLHTGDIGHIDEKGRIVITDRKKDLIVNDKGDNVSPQRVEGMLTLQPEILQAMVYGDKRPHLVGILVPDPEWATEWAEAQGLPKDLKLLREHEKFRAAVRAAVDRVNEQLSVIEKVRKFDFADEPFTIENEQMTPSMKIRRHILRQVYEDKIAALYGG
ncbi:AMP-dependent synthetase [Sphingopyxis sp. H071]|nr:AMP-dependent synthetase [Sphingopyxis sp. H057]KTE53103.1 AMP-dependent synthetase [Sphingopyxis sp. H073]KTE55292.1 AMP-dependent synthetase [Sphingopyxis sp. H071]KTE59380.1 AMP-dependent synthetase [Sphingopyxis sp. H107]KTE64184.1 AMP-dependent synthetase [Sphingopyxis sp. H100]KTE72795.1 AMP-dependent synthetase [Sphingopyxis sp. H081]KTE80127.1 AMP-dependent synthetase [Sphingopyxis sp. H067]